MSPIAEEIYKFIVQTLSPIDRLQLATLILDGLKQNVSVIDIRLPAKVSGDRMF